MRRASTVVGMLAVLLLGTGQAADPAAGPAPQVHTIRLPMSNVHLLMTPRPVLIDSGRPVDAEALLRALAGHGVRPADLGLLIASHGHSDHAGGVAALRRLAPDLPVMIGSGDVAMAALGHNDELRPTRLFAHLLERFAIDPRYPPFRATVEVADTLDLAPWGLRGRVVQWPGHTAGSLAVLLDDGRAFVGDMMLGGFFGGALFPQRAGEHYFHADRERSRANIHRLLAEPVQTIHLGHGGPVDRASVLAGFDIDDPRPKR